jgi:hypothetical protein
MGPSKIPSYLYHLGGSLALHLAPVSLKNTLNLKFLSNIDKCYYNYRYGFNIQIKMSRYKILNIFIYTKDKVPNS